jgi:hypothetical protein
MYLKKIFKRCLLSRSEISKEVTTQVIGHFGIFFFDFDDKFGRGGNL